MQREVKLNAIRRIFHESGTPKGDEVIFFCPKCKHRKKKLSINLRTDKFHCWVCGFSGKNLVQILRLGGNTKELSVYLDELGLGKKEEQGKKYDTPELPKEFVSLSSQSKSPYFVNAMGYLMRRGISFQDILLMKLGYCEDGEYKYRIIIPSFDENGELNFFVGRSFFDGQASYKHGNFCKDIIFNDYMIDWTEPVVITEGPFDAMKAGENAIPLQGKFLREDSKLFRKIVTSGVPVYFALDTDAVKQQLKIIDIMLTYGVESYHIKLNGKKDVGEMTREEFDIAKTNAKAIKSDMDVLRLRVYA